MNITEMTNEELNAVRQSNFSGLTKAEVAKIRRTIKAQVTLHRFTDRASALEHVDGLAKNSQRQARILSNY